MIRKYNKNITKEWEMVINKVRGVVRGVGDI
jgi:hypothetical protein